MRNNYLVFSYYILVATFLKSCISVVDYNSICSNSCSLITKDCLFTYSDIPINLKIICLLKSLIGIDKINTEDLNQLKYIRSKYNGTCLSPGGVSSNILVYDRLDSKVDFPVGYDSFPDTLRGKIISCVQELSNVENVRIVTNFRLDINRNTLDYFSGLTNNNLRNAELIPIKISDINVNSVAQANSDVRMYPSLGSFRKYEASDRILEARNLFFDPAPALILGIEIFMKSKTVANFIKVATQTARMIKVTSEMAGTINTFLNLQRNIAELYKKDKEDKDLSNVRTQEIILNGQKATLEYRKQDLEIQRGILLSNQLSNMLLTSINEELEGINNKLDEITDQLEKVNEELAEVGEKLDNLKKEIGDLDFDVEVVVNIPDLPSNDFGKKGESETSLGLDISEYISEYENLGCEDFVTQKHLIQETCFMYFFLSQESGKLSNEEYIRYRYDSTEYLTTENMREACLMIGGNHPKFTSKYLEMNISFYSDMIGMSDDQSLEFIETSPRMYLYLFIDLARSYSIDWFIKVFNVIRKNDGFNYVSMNKVSVQNFTNNIGNEQSICFDE